MVKRNLKSQQRQQFKSRRVGHNSLVHHPAKKLTISEMVYFLTIVKKAKIECMRFWSTIIIA
jgi:hypothetical protein